MKKSLMFACLLSVCVVSSFAQSPANAAGTRLVAERDAAYAKAHPAVAKDNSLLIHHAHIRHGLHHRHLMMKAVK